jgi:NADP-dependent 3-hydroxy acid dehydrogenase YdfG
MDVLDVTGSTVIVTGASSGIGAATARLLHAAGAHPVLAARRADRLAELSEELDGALAVRTDVTDPTAVRRLAEATLDRHGRIDGLVNNAEERRVCTDTTEQAPVPSMPPRRSAARAGRPGRRTPRCRGS